MADNFLDNVAYAGSNLSVNGNAIQVGSSTASTVSMIFSNSGGQAVLAWAPTANRTINLPDAGGTLLANSQGILSISAGGAAITSGQVIFSNANGVTFGANGQTITATVAGGGVAGQAGTQTATSGTIVFSNSNNITFGMSNSSVITASYNQSADTIGIYAVSNTTGAQTSSTYDARSLSIQGAGFVSVGHTNGSVVISVTTLISSAQTNQSMNFYAVGNTTQNSSTTMDARTISFNAVGSGISVGYSNGSVQLSVRDTTMVNFEPIPYIGATNYTPGAGSWYFDPFYAYDNMAGGRINIIKSFTSTANILVATTSASFGSATTGSLSNSYSYVKSLALYSLGSGTNSTRLESFWSNSFSIGLQHSVSIATGGATNISVTDAATISYVVSIDSAGAYTTTTFASSTQRTTASAAMGSTAITAALSSIRNMISGQFMMPIGFNTTIPAGNYWLAQAYNTASTTGGTSESVWAFSNQQAITVITQPAYRLWGQTAATANSQLVAGQGVYTSTSASPPATVAFASISNIGTNLRNYWNYVNSTI